jgi:outer membrane receptor for Fe3+-dicitrate
MLIAHFGNGDEIDQNVLLAFFESKDVKVNKLTIFPGINYGHLSFHDDI